MFSKIGKRVTYANVAMTLALVFAMSGGAYAAGKYLVTSTKQISPKVLTALKGKAGAAGKEGPSGKEGPAGKEGPVGKEGPGGKEGLAGGEGKAGSNGVSGESVTSTTLAAKNTNCPDGGSEFTVSGKHTYACTGAPWPAGGTLPAGQTETGTWGVAANPGSFAGGALVFTSTPISFPIPLKAGLGVGKVHIILAEENGAPGKGAGGGTCPTTSSVSKPAAEPGNLCIFEGSFALNFKEIHVRSEETGEEEEAGTTGTMVHAYAEKSSESVLIEGTWAVAAEAG